jgi:hypothetical protein
VPGSLPQAAAMRTRAAASPQRGARIKPTSKDRESWASWNVRRRTHPPTRRHAAGSLPLVRTSWGAWPDR